MTIDPSKVDEIRRRNTGNDEMEALYVGVASDGICNFLCLAGSFCSRYSVGPASFEADVLRILHERQRQVREASNPTLFSSSRFTAAPHIGIACSRQESSRHSSQFVWPPQISGLFALPFGPSVWTYQRNSRRNLRLPFGCS